MRNYPVVSGFDEAGRKINSAVTFSQDWETGARICLFPSVQKGSFLDKDNPYYASLLSGAAEFCANKLIVSFCMPQYACYKPGENPFIEYKVKSFYRDVRQFEVIVSITAEGREVYRKHITHEAAAFGEISGSAAWYTESFDTDMYEVTVKVLSGGRVVSCGNNAFVIWNEAVVRQGPELFNDGEYFSINGKPSVLLGTNYYDSNSNSAMWVLPNVSRLNVDLKQMAESGMNFFRVHYHLPKWFYDFWMQRYGTVPDMYKDLGNSYLPEEKYLRILDAHIYLCQKYHLIYGGNLFTMVPEEMGDPRGWGGVHDYCFLEEKLPAQLEFLDLVIPRYKNVPGIS